MKRRRGVSPLMATRSATCGCRTRHGNEGMIYRQKWFGNGQLGDEATKEIAVSHYMDSKMKRLGRETGMSYG